MSELTFELFFLGKKNSEGQVEKLTHGPFFSNEDAIKYNRKNHGWASEDYGIVKTKPMFEAVASEEKN